jgi:hypothetical protein
MAGVQESMRSRIYTQAMDGRLLALRLKKRTGEGNEEEHKEQRVS